MAYALESGGGLGSPSAAAPGIAGVAMASGLGGLNGAQTAPRATAADYSAMTRAMWYSYLNEIGVPQENKLIQYATDPNVVRDAMAEASADAKSAFATQQQASTERLRGLGMTLSADEKAAADRESNLAASLADVGAQNRARDQTLARQQAIIGSPAPTIGALR